MSGVGAPQLGWADHLFVSCCGYICVQVIQDLDRLRMHQAEAVAILPQVNRSNPLLHRMALAFEALDGAPTRSGPWASARVMLASAYADFLEVRAGQAQAALGRVPA